MSARVHDMQEGGVPCGCGRSPTGFCTGLHALSEEEFNRRIMEGLVYPGEFTEEENKQDEH